MCVSDDEDESACDCTNTWPSDLVSAECESFDAGAGMSSCNFYRSRGGVFQDADHDGSCSLYIVALF